jgi:hypothetical protein
MPAKGQNKPGWTTPEKAVVWLGGPLIGALAMSVISIQKTGNNSNPADCVASFQGYDFNFKQNYDMEQLRKDFLPMHNEDYTVGGERIATVFWILIALFIAFTVAEKIYGKFSSSNNNPSPSPGPTPSRTPPNLGPTANSPSIQ